MVFEDKYFNDGKTASVAAEDSSGKLSRIFDLFHRSQSTGLVLEELSTFLHITAPVAKVRITTFGRNGLYRVYRADLPISDRKTH